MSQALTPNHVQGARAQAAAEAVRSSKLASRLGAAEAAQATAQREQATAQKSLDAELALRTRLAQDDIKVRRSHLLVAALN